MSSQNPFPLMPPRSTELRLLHFDDAAYAADSSTILYKLVDALCGITGAGALVNEIFLARLGGALETIYFNDLDYVFSKINFLSRSPAESYSYDPMHDQLTSDQWSEVRTKDAWYRDRVKKFFQACTLGSTVDGMRMTVDAAVGVDADVFEVYRYVDDYSLTDPLGRTPFSARNEVVVRPHKSSLAPEELRLLRDMLAKVCSIDTIVTVDLNGLAVHSPLQISGAAASSTYFEVQKMVLATPALDQLPAPELLSIDLLPTETWLYLAKVDPQLAPYTAFNISAESAYFYLVGGGRRSPIDSVTYGCADVDTEILTLRGWLRYDEVTNEDTCLTLNTETGQSEWQPVKGVYVFPGQHEVIKMENLSHSSVTTHDHRWPVTFAGNRNIPGWNWRTTETLTSKTRICAAAPVLAPTEPKWSDALVELVAWTWTEGHIRPHGGVVIAQSQVANPEFAMRIRAALTQTFGSAGELYVRSRPSWREEVNERGIVHFHLNKRAGELLLLHAPNKVVSIEFLSQLTRAQLELFIQTSIDADGYRRSSGATLRQRDKARLDAFQIACALAGKAGVVRYDDPDDMWRMCIAKNPWRIPAKSKYIQEITIDTPVWCVSTTNQTWFARRNGTMYATGNTIDTTASEPMSTYTTENNYQVFDTIGQYTDKRPWDRCDSPDNYPGGRYGIHPSHGPALNPDGTPYHFPFLSQTAYVLARIADILGLGGIADNEGYRLPIQQESSSARVYWPSHAIAYFPPTTESTVTTSICHRRQVSATTEIRNPLNFVR